MSRFLHGIRSRGRPLAFVVLGGTTNDKKEGAKHKDKVDAFRREMQKGALALLALLVFIAIVVLAAKYM